MNKRNDREIAEEIQRLARRLRRFFAYNDDHVTRLDRLRLILLEHEGISLRDLARLLDIRPPSLSEWVTKLTEDGEIVKERDDEDRRSVRISLTDKGRELALSSKEKAEESGGIFAGCLTEEERNKFLEACEKLHAHLTKLAETRWSQGRGHHHHYHHRHGGRPHRSCNGHEKGKEEVNEKDDREKEEGSYG